MTTNLSASVLARLLNLAKQRGDDYNRLLNRFALERLLCRIAASPHADRFLLKGALLFALWYDEPPRPTRDADLLGFGPDDAATMISTFRDIAATPMDDGIVFDPQSVRADAIREDNRYGGLRVRRRCVRPNTCYCSPAPRMAARITHLAFTAARHCTQRGKRETDRCDAVLEAARLEQ